MIPRNQVNRRNIFTEKNARFLKVLTTFYKVISKIISTIVIKKRYKYEDKKDTTYLLKMLKSFNAT